MTSFNNKFEEYVENEIFNLANQLNNDPIFLKESFLNLIHFYKNNNLSKFEMSNQQLELLFSASTALAFTTWQHLAAVERLSSLEDWKIKNIELYSKLLNGDKTCGLATTHLAKPNKAGLTGAYFETKNQFVISGVAEWVCGFQIFDYLLVGFSTNEEIIFAIIDYPLEKVSIDSSVIVNPVPLNSLQGTSTVSIQFNEFLINDNEVVSRRRKQDIPVIRQSQFKVPEIGIGIRAIKEISRISETSKHPKFEYIKISLDTLNQQLNKIYHLRSVDSSVDELILSRDSFNQSSVRLLSIALGADSLNFNSLSFRLMCELQLFDILVHSPTLLKNKILKIGTI